MRAVLKNPSRQTRMPCPYCYGGGGWITTAKLGVDWEKKLGTTVAVGRCCPRCNTGGLVPFEPMG